MKVEKGCKIKVEYEGKLDDGKVFDSSAKHGKPLEFEVGAGQMIKGFDEAFELMRKGEKLTLIIPPELGYGARAKGTVIPANSTLIFEVELVDIR